MSFRKIYIVHDLTHMTQQVVSTQRGLARYLRDEGCRVDNNQISEIANDNDKKYTTEDGRLLCVEELA